MTPTPPPRPSPTAGQFRGYSLETVFRLRDDLAAVLAHEYAGGVLPPDGLAGFVARACQVLSDTAPVDPAAVAGSLRTLAGVRLSRKLIRETAWRLAGNLPRLTAGESVGPWRGQRAPEWVPAQVLSVTPRRGSAGGRLRYRVAWKILAGTPCPLQAEVSWGLKTLAYLSPRFGFTRARDGGWSPRPFADPSLLVSMRAEVLIDPAECKDGPGFKELRFAYQPLKDWNRELHRYRLRAEPGYGCRYRLPASLPCHRCAVGVRDCRAATHPATYTPGPCPGCGRDDALFDPAAPAKACVNCTRRALRGRSPDTTTTDDSG